MKKIGLKDIRDALIDLGCFTEEEMQEISDETLKEINFKDIGLDSITSIVFLQKLEGGTDKLSLINVDIWSCKTINDLLDKTASSD